MASHIELNRYHSFNSVPSLPLWATFCV